MPEVKQRGVIRSVTVDGKPYEVGASIYPTPQEYADHHVHHILERMDPNGTACWAVYVELYLNGEPSGYVSLWKDLRGTNIEVEYEFQERS